MVANAQIDRTNAERLVGRATNSLLRANFIFGG